MHLEGNPGDDQKERLEDFLSELNHITRKYGILLLDESELSYLFDVWANSIIGVGLAHFAAPDNPKRIVGYVPADSILDGTWLVDGPDGPVEQHTVQNVFPLRDQL